MSASDTVKARLGGGVVAAKRVAVMRRAGMVEPGRLDESLRSLVEVDRYGPVAGAGRRAARQAPGRVGLIDDRGSLTYGDLDRRSDALARALRAQLGGPRGGERGIGADSGIGLLCRDHRYTVETMLAAGKLGARLVLLNTGFAAPQLADVVEREGVDALVHDEEFTEVLREVPERVPRHLAWSDDHRTAAEPESLEAMVAETGHPELARPTSRGGVVLLTSGTTGTPKGAPRQVRSALAAADFLDRVPLHAGETTVLAAPLFHAFGFAQFTLGLGLGSTLILRRRFDPATTLADLARHRASTLICVPTMLRRILELGDEEIAAHDTSALRIVFTSGSALPPSVVERTRAVFGEINHDLYGSTEVAVAAIATPADLRAAPGTIGRPPVGVTVRLYDDDDTQITAPDTVGRIFVGSSLKFTGYTGGGSKDIIDGLVATGDVGHLDADGRWFVDGRDDDMIVSGGENVFPAEVTELLEDRDEVAEAAVIGVDDEAFGQRLRAFVAPAPGAEIDTEALRTHVKEHLARHKVPREVVVLDALPRNATGKVVTRELPTDDLEH